MSEVKRYDCVLSQEHGDEPEDYEAAMVAGTDWVVASDHDSKVAEQDKTIERLRRLLVRERHEVRHMHGCDCELCREVDAALEDTQ